MALGLVGLALVVAAPALAAPDPVADLAAAAAEHRRLETGETLSELSPVTGRRASEGSARRLLEAPFDRVVRTLRDHDHYAEFMPFMVSSRAWAEPDGEISCAQRLDLPFPLPDRHYTVRGRSRQGAVGGHRVFEETWRYVAGSGNIRDNFGSWTAIEMAAGETLVVFRIYPDFVPWVPAHLQDKATRRSLPWILDGLRQQVRRCRYDDPPAPGCREEPPGP